MKARTVLSASLCGTLLLGCSSFPSLSGLFDRWKSPPQVRVAKDADAEYQRGKRLHLAGQYADAQKAYLSALAIDPSHPEAKNGLAALIGANGDLDRAIGLLVELSTNYPASHVAANLGRAYELKGRDFDAREAYQRAVDLDPGNETARHRLIALDEKLQATVVVDAVIDERPLPTPPVAQATIESVGPSMYAMRYPADSLHSPTAEVHADAISNEPVKQPVKEPTEPVAARELQIIEQRPRALPVELVNANGVTGLARQLRSLLPGEDWRVVRTRNHDNFGVGVTRIEYAPSHRKEAQRFANEVGIPAKLHANSELQGAHLRVVLGHDCRSFEQLKQKLAERQLAAL